MTEPWESLRQAGWPVGHLSTTANSSECVGKDLLELIRSVAQPASAGRQSESEAAEVSVAIADLWRFQGAIDLGLARHLITCDGSIAVVASGPTEWSSRGSAQLALGTPLGRSRLLVRGTAETVRWVGSGPRTAVDVRVHGRRSIFGLRRRSVWPLRDRAPTSACTAEAGDLVASVRELSRMAWHREYAVARPVVTPFAHDR